MWSPIPEDTPCGFQLQREMSKICGRNKDKLLISRRCRPCVRVRNDTDTAGTVPHKNVCTTGNKVKALQIGRQGACSTTTRPRPEIPKVRTIYPPASLSDATTSHDRAMAKACAEFTKKGPGNRVHKIQKREACYSSPRSGADFPTHLVGHDGPRRPHLRSI